MFIEIALTTIMFILFGIFVQVTRLLEEPTGTIAKNSPEALEEELFAPELGSDHLHKINSEFDQRIKEMEEELKQPPGVLYNIPPEFIDRQYVKLEPEEYAK